MKYVKHKPVRQQARASKKDRKPHDLGFYIHPILLDAIRKDANKFNVTAAFIINTAVAVTMGIDVGEKYYIPKDVEKKRKNGHVVHFRKRA